MEVGRSEDTPTAEEEHEHLGLCPWCIGSESLNRGMTYSHTIADKGYGEFDAFGLEGALCAEVGRRVGCFVCLLSDCFCKANYLTQISILNHYDFLTL
jgi:hypothetical protein